MSARSGQGAGRGGVENAGRDPGEGCGSLIGCCGGPEDRRGGVEAS